MLFLLPAFRISATIFVIAAKRSRWASIAALGAFTTRCFLLGIWCIYTLPVLRIVRKQYSPKRPDMDAIPDIVVTRAILIKL